MIEEIILNYLIQTLSVPVYLEQPKDKPEQYVLFEKTGSSKKNHINNVTIAIQSYADSKYNAAEINEKVKDAMDRIIYEEDISKSKLNSDYDYTDTDLKKYRYQAIYSLTY